MWVALHEQAIFVGARLALIAVDNQISRPNLLRGQTPLRASRKPCATSTENCRAFYIFVDFICRPRQSRAQTFVSICCEIALERERIGEFKTRSNNFGSISCDKARCVHECFAHSAALPSSHAGDSLTSSGALAPTALDASIDWRTFERTPCGGNSSFSLPSRKLSINRSKSAGVTRRRYR